jgi:isochorismate pyruvate lyase
MGRKSPAEIGTIAELRDEIDTLDRALVRMLAERAGYIDRAAQLKPGEGLPARIEDRVQQVLDNASANACDLGLDPDLARALWQQMIEWSIAREERAMDSNGETL